MERRRIRKPMRKITTTRIDSDVLARINDRVARAHEEYEKPFLFKKPKKGAYVPVFNYSILK